MQGHPESRRTLLLICWTALPHKPELLRPAVVLCPGGGYGFVSPREDQPVAMEFLAAGCQVFSLHYSVAPETFPVALMELAKAVALVKNVPVNGILIRSGLWCAVSPREATWPPAWA